MASIVNKIREGWSLRWPLSVIAFVIIYATHLLIVIVFITISLLVSLGSRDIAFALAPIAETILNFWFGFFIGLAIVVLLAAFILDQINSKIDSAIKAILKKSFVLCVAVGIFVVMTIGMSMSVGVLGSSARIFGKLLDVLFVVSPGIVIIYYRRKTRNLLANVPATQTEPPTSPTASANPI